MTDNRQMSIISYNEVSFKHAGADVSQFIGRSEEITLLEGLLEKNTASLAVISGRRRIGKSRLAEKFSHNRRLLSFTGLPPRKSTTSQDQLNEFTKQMERKLQIELKPFTDWGDVFHCLAKHNSEGQVILLFDEISWMGSCDPDFLGKLKTAWDEEFKKNDRLILILCGSVSAWIKRNIISSTGFYGRISLKLNLQELPIRDCTQFWQGSHLSVNEKLKILSITGGVPKYLEEINPNQTAEENIKRLCFTDSGILYNDYDYIFSALLQRNSEYYHKIVEFLVDKTAEQKTIISHLESAPGGMIAEILDELVISGFLARDYVWQLNSGKISRLSKYRLSDNYLRFFLKYIKPNVEKIRNKQFKNHSISALPGWSTIMGLQIENLVLNNRELIREKLKVYPDEVACDGAFFQRKTARQSGCQIDYMVQTTLGNLFVCEVKFTRNIIRSDIIGEVKQKIDRLSIPRACAVKPILIHAGDVHDEVIDSMFFVKIINLADLFK